MSGGCSLPGLLVAEVASCCMGVSAKVGSQNKETSREWTRERAGGHQESE